MRKVIVFNQVSLDGYFTDAGGDMSWAHKHDAEWTDFVSQNASGGGLLLFGRVTYDMMKSYWPTPAAARDNPTVARAMNELPKVVFSRSLERAEWQNTELIKRDIAAAVRAMKAESGPDMVLMGSGTIVAQLTDARLVDEYQVVLNPIVLGRGRTMFEGVKEKLTLTAQKTRKFGNGNVVIWYQSKA